MTTNVLYLLLIVILMLLFAIWNGLINKQMYQDVTLIQKRNTSKLWHKVGVVIRLTLGGLSVLTYGELGGLIATILAYPIYEKVINVIRGLDFNYYGESTFDQITKKYALDWIVLIVCVLRITILIINL